VAAFHAAFARLALTTETHHAGDEGVRKRLLGAYETERESQRDDERDARPQGAEEGRRQGRAEDRAGVTLVSAFREFRSIEPDRCSILFNMSSDAAPAFPPASVPPAENDPVPASARAVSPGAAVDATLRRVLAGAQARLDSDRARLREAGLIDAVGNPTTDRLPDDMAPGSASHVKTG
jgi:hypothetical protein